MVPTRSGSLPPSGRPRPTNGVEEEPDVPQSPPRGWVDDPGRPTIVAPTGPLRPVTTTRTNIVVIMLDDLAELDLRVWERLPTIKSLMLDHGIRFTRYYGNDPLCCPGRANFLTGLYTDHHGVWQNEGRLLDPSVTVATELQGAGYHTILSGKYLNGLVRVRDKTPPGWSRVTIHQNGYYRYTLFRNGVAEYHDNDPNDYSTDLFANDLVAGLRAAPPSRPVFALFTPFSVHAGLDATARGRVLPVPAPRHVGDPRCDGIPPWRPANYAEADISDKPAYVQTHRSSANLQFQNGWPMESICETLLSVDDALARVVAELRMQGRLADTVFILTADNGMGFGSNRWIHKAAPYTTQIPLFVSWTEGRGSSPAESDVWLSNVDMAPTLCAIGGCLMGPYRSGRWSSDGISFLDMIAGSTRDSSRDFLYEEHRQWFSNHEASPWRAVRTTDRSPLGLWHYIEYDSGERELYDTSGGQCRDWVPGSPGDPCELTNVAGDPELEVTEASLADLLAQTVDRPLARVP
jgi:arylsulfatase A-like enzyme